MDLQVLKAMRAQRLSRPEIAIALDRSVDAVARKLDELNLARRHQNENFRCFLKEKIIAGWTNRQIAEACQVTMRIVVAHRDALGIKPENRSEQKKRAQRVGRAAVRVNRGKQLLAAGWPEDITLAQGRLLDAFWEFGPMTLKEVAEKLGLKWRQHNTFKGCLATGEYNYFHDLMHRGLIVSLGRLERGERPGQNFNVYSLPIWVERKAA